MPDKYGKYIYVIGFGGKKKEGPIRAFYPFYRLVLHNQSFILLDNRGKPGVQSGGARLANSAVSQCKPGDVVRHPDGKT